MPYTRGRCVGLIFFVKVELWARHKFCLSMIDSESHELYTAIQKPLNITRTFGPDGTTQGCYLSESGICFVTQYILVVATLLTTHNPIRRKMRHE